MSSNNFCVLADKFQRVTDKNSNSNTNVLTISAQHGLINQFEYYNHQYASENTSGYTLLKKGDFAYNKSYSDGYPWGATKRLERYDSGIVSPLYICFSAKDGVCADFYSYYFESEPFFREIYKIAQEGARNHGLLNVSTEDFFKMQIANPPLEEQRRIAKILGCCDRMIALKKELIAEKKKQKKALMQKIFVAAQSCVKLETLSEIIMGQSPPSEAYNKNRIGAPLIQGNADIVNRNFQARMWTNIITQTCKKHDIIISVRAPVGTVAKASCDACIGRGVAAIRVIENPEYIFQYLLFYEDKWQKISQGSTFDSIGGKEIKSLSIPLFDTITQKRIADILSAADKEIDLLEQELSQQEQKKKSLMQLLLTGIVRV